jgi:hypothetical protein
LLLYAQVFLRLLTDTHVLKTFPQAADAGATYRNARTSPLVTSSCCRLRT